MLIWDMTAMKLKYELNYNKLPFPIDYEIWTAGRKPIVRRTVAECEQYTGLLRTK